MSSYKFKIKIVSTVWNSFNRNFWSANLMEFFERWAYYGVRVVLSVYIVKAASAGGLEFNHIQKGYIYSGWAIVQSTLPILSGGYADLYGHKRTIFSAVILKIIGYLLMASQHSFFGFFSGCMLLATGTAIFKPAVQGLMASNLPKQYSSISWGVFYWLVNLGAFLGAVAAGYLRMISWPTVFYANAFIVSLNLVFLFLTQNSEPQSSNNSLEAKTHPWTLTIETLKGMFQPKLISFLLIYSGFWMMYNQIFDTLPNFLDDWINSAGVLIELGKFTGNKEWISAGLNGEAIPQEWILSLNCLVFIFLMLPFAWLVRKLNLIYSMVGGILLTIAGTTMFGSSNASAWICIAGLLIFSVGEMAAGPRMREYLGLESPHGQEGRYMGYANLPEAIGWGFGSLVAGFWYEHYSDKHTLAKKYLIENLHVNSQTVLKMPKENILPTLSDKLGLDSIQLSEMLWQIYHPEKIWFWFACVGMMTVIGLIIHNVVFKDSTDEKWLKGKVID